MTGFEPATTRPPDAYSNRTELHPECGCKSTHFSIPSKFSAAFFTENSKKRPEYALRGPVRTVGGLDFSIGGIEISVGGFEKPIPPIEKSVGGIG